MIIPFPNKKKPNVKNPEGKLLKFELKKEVVIQNKINRLRSEVEITDDDKTWDEIEELECELDILLNRRFSVCE